MPYSHTFFVPDYYPAFACKCGECRSTCCGGWGIALSMDDYFHVTGIDCSPELRRRLDIAFRPADPAPTPERYMMISYNWLGRCPLQRDDGFCALHRECGEGAIPAICRRYPRSIRVAPIHEVCTSTSCERTLELLFASDAPMSFRDVPLELIDEEFDENPAAHVPAEAYRAVRAKTFALLSDRTQSLDERLAAIAAMLGTTLPALTDADTAALFARFARTSSALQELESAFTDARFDLASVPEMDIYLEKILANHLFYKGFPHSFVDSKPRDEMAAAAAALALTRYAASRYLGKSGWNFERFIDCTARLYRMIEHSRFDETAARLVK